MKAKIVQQLLIQVIVIITICLVMLGACRQPAPPIPPTLQPTLSPVILPKFLFHIYPAPGEPVTQGRWGTSIGAILNLGEIAELGETLALEDIRERVKILIDGEQQLNVRIYQGIKPVQVEIAENPLLSPGGHKASIQIHKTSGELLEYTWEFTVMDEEPTLPNLPEGFQFVRPLPASTISLQSYQEKQLVPQYYFPAFANLRGGVCVGVLADKVVERGEFVDTHPVGKKYTFVALDSVPPGTDVVIEGGTEASKNEFYENGQLIRSYGGPHHYKCWRIDLAPGQHKATVRLQKSSGDIEYTWVFTITNN